MALLTYTHRQIMRQFSISWHFARVVIFGIGALFAFIPFIITLTNHEFVILPTIAAVVFVTHLVLTLRTLYVAAHAQPWASPHERELLALTGVSAKTVVITAWKATLRTVWLDHVIFSVLRLGLAVGIAQVLNMDFGACFRVNMDPFCYYGGNYVNPMSPQLSNVAAIALVLMLFAWLEASLLSAIGVFVSYLMQQSRQAIRVVAALGLRSAICAGVLLGWTLLSQVETNTTQMLQCVPDSYCNRTYQYQHSDGYWLWIPEKQTDYGRWQSDLTTQIALVNFSRTVITPVGDNATLLAADALRPSWGILSNLYRTLPLFIVGALLYVALIRFLLWRAQRLAVQRGMLA